MRNPLHPASETSARPPAAQGLVWSAVAASLIASALPAAVAAQGPGRGLPDTVSWSVSSPDEAKRGGKLSLTLQGVVQPGWHVYGLKQLPTGPTPLKVALEQNEVATADGAPAGSAPVKRHDPSFDLETQYYEQPFTVKTPVRIAPKAAAGRQLIPVSVRFQTCNGQICHPPKTVRLSVPVTVREG